MFRGICIVSVSQPLFKLKSDFKPAGSQPEAILALSKGLHDGIRYQTLLGVTGSGKTFTAANVIAKQDKPVLVIAHNKTLAAQLAQEYREFFPENSVHYFVSYYDFYQPEAYMPITDTYIEKEAMINDEIDRLRHAATQALLTRRDVIVVASVSCIYNLGSPEEYEKENLKLVPGKKISRAELARALAAIYYERTNADLEPGLFRAVGNAIEIMPVNERVLYRVEFEDDLIGGINSFDPVSRVHFKSVESIFLFPAKHFVTQDEKLGVVLKNIKSELAGRLKQLEKGGKLLEAERLKRRTNYDIAMIREIGYCNGIENYSRHFSGKNVGDPPDTLLAYFPKKRGQMLDVNTPDFLTVIDESHVTVSQIGGMYAGDQSRKKTLIEHGFRLPSAADNRPLTFDEFTKRIGQVIFTSATPADYEREVSGSIVEQVIRPTGLIDPEITIKPVSPSAEEKAKAPRPKWTCARPVLPQKEEGYKGQIKDFMEEAKSAIKKGERVIATTLTKKMAEDLSAYLKEQGYKAEYLHSEIKTVERIQILTDFRKGVFDCLVGVNLLREGLDLPEVALIGILDADKEGFLRSETSLIQIIGRAARNINGRVIIYADNVTGSIERAVQETNRRRALQLAYNEKHGITPKTITKAIKDITDTLQSSHDKTVSELLMLDMKSQKNRAVLIKEKEKQMNEAVKTLDFETAAILRDEIKALKLKKNRKLPA